MRNMSYAIFADSKLITICDTLSQAITSIPKDSKDTHIFNEDKEEVLFFKRGKLNGGIENK
jgi:hypothetical protein